jgi:hypothetical protein
MGDSSSGHHDVGQGIDHVQQPRVSRALVNPARPAAGTDQPLDGDPPAYETSVSVELTGGGAVIHVTPPGNRPAR